MKEKTLSRVALTAMSAVVAALLPSLAHAELYVGIKGGPGFNTGTTKIFDPASTLDSTELKGGAGLSGWGGGTIGAGVTLPGNWRVGIEANALAHSLDNTEFLQTYSYDGGVPEPKVRLRNKFLYGGNIYLGYEIKNAVMPFISVGALAGKYTMNLSNQGDYGAYGIEPGMTQEFHKTIVGVTPGLGIKYKLGDRLQAGLEYKCMLGGKMSHTYVDSSDIEVTVTDTYQQRITQHLVGFMLEYRLQD